jgi:hypothetical protein
MLAPGLARLEVSINYLLRRDVLFNVKKHGSDTFHPRLAPRVDVVRYKAATIVNYLAFSKYVNERCVSNLWSCEACGHEHETSALFSQDGTHCSADNHIDFWLVAAAWSVEETEACFMVCDANRHDHQEQIASYLVGDT